jgi:hypothetical protein
MKTKIFAVLALALSIIGPGMAANVVARDVLPSRNAVRSQALGAQSLEAPSLIIESLDFGVAADVYRVTCSAECIRADVNDIGPFNDTLFKVTVIGSSDNFAGEASAISPPGGLSLEAEVCSGSNTNHFRRAYVVITEVNDPGEEDYDSLISCRRANGDLINPTVVQILDQ